MILCSLKIKYYADIISKYSNWENCIKLFFPRKACNVFTVARCFIPPRFKSHYATYHRNTRGSGMYGDFARIERGKKRLLFTSGRTLVLQWNAIKRHKIKYLLSRCGIVKAFYTFFSITNEREQSCRSKEIIKFNPPSLLLFLLLFLNIWKFKICTFKIKTSKTELC